MLEIFYLFSVRYLSSCSLSWRGVLGTPPVLWVVGSVTVLQFFFTYTPLMAEVFQSRPDSLADGLLVVSMGIALFAILEVEKLALRLWRGQDHKRESV